jgi:arsenical pump membrane protein
VWQANNAVVQNGALAIVFLGTIGALYFRPFGARDWHIAGSGAVAAWVIGPLGFRQGLETVGDSANIVAFFLGLMLLAAGAESAGLYARAALILRRRASVRSRVATVLVLGTLITAVLSNDATPLVLTPAIFAAGVVYSRATTDSALAATFTADGASLLLPVSNPVNLLFFERFEMGFGQYLQTITPAALAGIAAMAMVTWRRSPATRVAAEDEAPPVRQAPPRTVAPAQAVVLGQGVADVGARLAGVPLGAVTLGGGVALYFAARAAGPIEFATYRKHVSPGILVFVASLLLLVENLVAAGVLDRLAAVLTSLEGQPAVLTVFGAAAIAAGLANLMNNWPSALLLAATIASAPGNHEALVAGALIGSAIGANFTMVGSLSTVFWLSLARQYGANYTAGKYARLAFAPTLAGMLAACVVAAVLV